LADQDRSRHDRAKIDAGRAALDQALALRADEPCVLQAAIASLPAEKDVDWNEVTGLYEQLERLTGSAVVALNRAVAVAEAGTPERALELVEYRYLHSTRAELLHRLGRDDEARKAFERALRLAATDTERRFLARRLADLGRA
jgi:RNA polymerase sigma-70 factor, ECF subfamily